MPLYSDFGLYYPGAGLPSYYGGGMGGAWGLARPLVGLRFSPLLPPLAELGRRYSPLPPTRVSSPRRYLPPRPTYVDTADIDVVSPRMNPVSGGLREIRRDRTLVRIHTSKVKDSPALQKARRKTPGERLVEKFLIRDKADEAKRKADEQKEKEKMLQDLAASAQAEAPAIGGMSEADALDILLTSEEHKLAQDVRRKPTLKSFGSTKRKSKRRDSLPGEPDPETMSVETQRKPSLLQRRNTVKKRRNSQDLSLDLQAAVSSRRSSLASEVDPMEALMETEESGDKTPVLKFVVDEICVEESPVSPRKFCYEIIVEDVSDDTTNELCKSEKPSDDLSDKAEVSPKSFQSSKWRVKKTKAVEKVSGDKTPDNSKPKVKAPIPGKVASAAKKTVTGVTDGIRYPVAAPNNAIKNLKTIVEEANSLTSSSSLDSKTPVDLKSDAVSVQYDTGVAKSVTNKDTVSVPKEKSVFDSKIVGGEDNKRVQVSSKDTQCVKKSKLSSCSVSPEPTPVQIQVNVDNHKTEQNISKIVTPIIKTKQTSATEEKVKVVSTIKVPVDETHSLQLSKNSDALEKREVKEKKTRTPVENVVDKTIVLLEPKSSANEHDSNLEKAQAKQLTDKNSNESAKLSSTNEQLIFSEKTQGKQPKPKAQNDPCSIDVQSNILSSSPSPKSEEKKMKPLTSLLANELDKKNELYAKIEAIVKPKKSDVSETQSDTQVQREKAIGKVPALKTKIPPTTESNFPLGVKNKDNLQSSPQDKTIEYNVQTSGEKALGKFGALKAKIPPLTESIVTLAVKNKEVQQMSAQDKRIEPNLQISGEKTLGKVSAPKNNIPPTEESNDIIGVINKADKKTSTQGKHIECSSPTSAVGKVGALKTKILSTTESIATDRVKNKDDQKTLTQDKHIVYNSQTSGEKSVGNVETAKINIPPTGESITKEDQEMPTQAKLVECSATSVVGKVGALKTKILPTIESIVTEGVKNRDDKQVLTQDRHIESKNKNEVSTKSPPSQKSSDAVETVSKTFPKINKKVVSNNSESVAVNHENEKITAKTELKEEPAEEINFWAFIKGAEEEYVARPIFRTNSEPNRQMRDSLHVASDAENKTGSSYSLDSTTLVDNSSLKSGVRGNAILQKTRREAGKLNALRDKDQPKDSSTISPPNSPISGGPAPKGKKENAAVTQTPTNLLSKPPVQPKVPKVQPHGAKTEGKILAKPDDSSNVPPPSAGADFTENSHTTFEKTNKKATEPLTKTDLHTTISNSIHPQNSKQGSESKSLLGNQNSSDRSDNSSEVSKSKDISNGTHEVSNHGKEDIIKKLNVKSDNQKVNLSRSPNDPLKKFNFKVNAESFDDISKKPDRKNENLKTHHPAENCDSNSDSLNLLKSSKEMLNKSETSKLFSNTLEVNKTSDSKSSCNSTEGNVILKSSNVESVKEMSSSSNLPTSLNLKESSVMPNAETKKTAEVNLDKSSTENISADAQNKVEDSNDKCKTMTNNIPKKVVRKPKQLVKASKTTDLSHLQDAIKHKDEDKVSVSAWTAVSSLTNDENKCTSISKAKFTGILPRRSKTPPPETKVLKKATADTGQPIIAKMVKDNKEDLKAQVNSCATSSEILKLSISPSGSESVSKQSQVEEPKTPKLVVTDHSSDPEIRKKIHEPSECNTNTKKTEFGTTNVAKKTEENNDVTKPLNFKTAEANEVNQNTSQVKPTADILKKIKKIHVENTDSAAENKSTTMAESTPSEIMKEQAEGFKSARNEVEVPDSKDNLTKLAVAVEKAPNTQIKNKNVPKGSQLPESPMDITLCQDSIPKLNVKDVKNNVKVKPKCANIQGKSPEMPFTKTNDKEVNTAANKKLEKPTQLKLEPLPKTNTGNCDNTKPKDKLVPSKELPNKTDNSDLEKKPPISPTKDIIKKKIITDKKEMTETKIVESSNNGTDIEKEEDLITKSTPAEKQKKIAVSKEKPATETSDEKPKVKKVIVKNKVGAKTEVSVDNKKCNKEEKANEPADSTKLEAKRETSSANVENHNSENVVDTVKAEKLVSCNDVSKTKTDQGENKIVKDEKEPKKCALGKPKMGKAQKAKTKEGNAVAEIAKDEENEKGVTQQPDKDKKESVTQLKDSVGAKKTSSGQLFSDSESESSSQRTSTSSNDSGFDSLPDCDVNCHRKCEKLMPHLCGVNQKLIVEALRSVKRVPSTATATATATGSEREGASPLAWNPALALDDAPGSGSSSSSSCSSGSRQHPALTIPRFRKYGADDFQFLKVLGKGSFGKVLLAELRGTERYYAVKCLKKDVVLEDNDVECTLIERKVLALGTRHPYLCHLFCTFQTESHLLFVLEYLNGGDLMFHIQQSGRFPEPRARFYAAEIVSGLKFLHKKGIVYRDLKLDNILLDYDGHIRIADFGMCKLQIFLDRMADTFCGTPDYMAPEIIKGLRYNQCVDWWSFGILLYEMLIGVSPFSGCDDNELFWSICNETPQYPRFLSQEAHNILLLLLEKDTTKRLGTAECPAGDVSDQPFFRPIDWFALERRELDPPFKPRVQHPLDVQYFDTTFTNERAQLTPVDKSILETMDQTQFEGFSYTNPYATD